MFGSTIAAALVLAARSARGDASPATPRATPPSFDVAEMIRDSTSPIPRRSVLKFKPAYTWPASGGYRADLGLEAVFAYAGFIIPEVNVPNFRSLARLEWTASSVQGSSGAFGGLGDIRFVDAVARTWGTFGAGLGYCTVFPSATTPGLGQGKWQLGPALVLSTRALANVDLAVLVQNFYSVAGNSQSPDLAYVAVQPLLTAHLPAQLYVATNATMSFYWRGPGTTVPINLVLGRAFGPGFAGSIEVDYTIAGAGLGNVFVEATLIFRL
jgi:hypothetical protein